MRAQKILVLIFSMTFSLRQENKGFTLIEFQLYLFLLVTMLTLLGGIGISVLESKSKAKTLEDINYTAPLVFEILESTVARATAINEPATAEVATSLSLEMPDPDKNPTIFELVDEKVFITEGSREPVALSPDSLTVTGLSFINTTASDRFDTVRVELRIDGYGKEIYRTTDVEYLFYTSLSTKN